MAALVERAPAKVNLTLAVLGRRADGYHLLDSLVVFADLADRLSLVPGPALSLEVRGESLQDSKRIAQGAKDIMDSTPQVAVAQHLLGGILIGGRHRLERRIALDDIGRAGDHGHLRQLDRKSVV